MGLFDFFRKPTPERTAETMCAAYRDALSKGATPKIALQNSYLSVANRNAGLKNIDPEYYLSSIFKDEYNQLTENQNEAKEFAVRVIMNILAGYLHPEIDSMREGMNMTSDSFMSWGEKEKKVEGYVRTLLT
jgi:hypothetical protein